LFVINHTSDFMISSLLTSVLLPIVFSLPIYLIGRRNKKLAGILSFLILTVSGMLLLIRIPSISNGQTIIEKYSWVESIDLRFDFLADKLSLPIASVITFLSGFAALASVAYLEKKRGHGTYYFFLLLFAAGMIGLVLATNLLQFYIFWEMMIIPSFFLIGGWGYKKPWRIAIKYFLWMRVGGLCLLFAILWLYTLTGSFDINVIQQATIGENLIWIASLFILAFLIKMAVIPFHNWLPDAHSEAPTPISAMLSGAMIKVGVYGIVRLVLGMFSSPTNWMFWLSGLGAITMLYGAILALMQKDIKRLLAYSSISQMGLILFGIMAANMGLAGALFHVINHAICKGLLFLGAGALVYRLGMRDMTKMGGLFRKMPITAVSMILAAVSLSATPPLSAFVSELMIVGGGMEAGYNIFVMIVLISSILTAGYFLWMTYKIFFGKLPKQFNQIKEAPLTFAIPLILLSVPIVIFGIWPELVLEVIT